MAQPKPIIIAVVLVLLGLLMVGGLRWWSVRSSASSWQALADRQPVTIQLDEHLLQVEVVNTQSSITRGLSDRAEIGSDGMLFIFDQREHQSFWMRRMQFDLDLVWIRDDNVVGVTAEVPAPEPGVPEVQLPTYLSPGPVDMVLELPAGKAEQLHIQPGSRISLEML